MAMVYGKQTKSIRLALIVTIIFSRAECIGSQRTVLDEKFIKLYRPLRLIGLNIVGRTSEIRENTNAVRRAGKVQTTMQRSQFFCDSYNGTSKRSSIIPTSIHCLRPGDIDIVGALGDSLTAGNGIFGINLLQVSVENRGVVWSIGGQGSWRQYLTLPNILKEFNPNLYGYSTKDGLSTDRSSKSCWYGRRPFQKERPSEKRSTFAISSSTFKVQTTMQRSQFFCDSYNGTSKRSSIIPTSIHCLRPGDIDIVGALGDSLTAGNGIFGINLLQVSVENRGVVWSIGGQGSWRQYLTLPNILKEFNPNLYGYSTKDGLSTDRSSKFNVAELGAMSRDIPFETKILVKRLKTDHMVNFTHHWKLVTIHIGNNDFCSDMCYYKNPEDILKWHETNMVKTLRYLRDNVPRLMINVVPAPNLRLLTKMVAVPLECQTTLRFECPCLVSKQNKTLNFLETIMLKWSKLERKIAYREEFNSDTFTVNIQPFTQFHELPSKPNGETDFRILSADCFHLSQRGHAACANALWNNMLEAEGKKSIGLVDAFYSFKCPTTRRPYISTRKNS